MDLHWLGSKDEFPAIFFSLPLFSGHLIRLLSISAEITTASDERITRQFVNGIAVSARLRHLFTPQQQ